ncbi:hypothetical protein C4561_01825 [candidate division WWE3 bacterium]|uniref:Uncharacterized protein n=1 Tax=candidate division WWE3 bacterium TaxID=2053526 RepID=A0A3A4ZF67_UNCKA|nr:MAG: hypothetical protein C4561_01825 [candidate division WWE3 bacterium]
MTLSKMEDDSQDAKKDFVAEKFFIVRKPNGAIHDVQLLFGKYQSWFVTNIFDKEYSYLQYLLDNVEMPKEVYSFIEDLLDDAEKAYMRETR